ncbi:hypothetical protein LAZ67_16001345 [Cordylochernes scorpioides]|uniref:Tetraspanin n=1 Tax=Cordylochernes scorpioides TaxID=51811 RepID=A0ABY6LB95_9ARAC|nr:hypothetical protein LAZ67_16001345 [Cordylochernes scorpioides]
MNPLHHRSPLTGVGYIYSLPISMVSTMVEGCGKTIKYALFLANFIIMPGVGGIVVFGVGVWTLAGTSFVKELVSSELYLASACLLISTGVVVTIIAFLGCMGALREIKCMLITFFIILFFIFILMIVGAILGYIFKNDLEQGTFERLESELERYGATNESMVTGTWNTIQTKLKCCGLEIEGLQSEPFRAWERKNSRFQREVRVPDSCCLVEGCARNPSPENVYNEGCYRKFKAYLQEHAKIMGGVAIGVACVLIIGMILSCALFLLIE